MHGWVHDIRTQCCSFCKAFSCCDERQNLILEIFQSVVRAGENKSGKGRGIQVHATDRTVYSHTVTEPRPALLLCIE